MQHSEASEPIANGHREDRVRVVYLDESVVIDVLNWISEPGNCCLVLPTGCGLPEGTRVLRVWSACDRRAIGAIVYHESFDPVVPGGIPPVIDGSGFSGDSLVLHRRDYPRM